MYNIYAFFDIDKVEYHLIEKYLYLLPLERQAKVCAYENEIDKINCILAYFLLMYGLKKGYGITDFQMDYSNYGKPYIKNNHNVFFNISHCKKACVCVISDSPIGIDVQEIGSIPIEVIDYCCTEHEKKYIEQSKNRDESFLKIWVMKESYLKMIGIGLRKEPKLLNVLDYEKKFKIIKENDCYIAISENRLW